MVGETVNFEMVADKAKGDGAKRQQSTILFPYLDLDAAVEVAHAMYKTRGHSPMEAHELAAQMGQTISGAFRLKTGTARIFGLTEKAGRDATKLSALGIAIIEPETEKEARAEAFMAVPLYREIYDKYKGQRLPPPKALEREMEALGVSNKQTDKARQAFDRSARQAGYFALGEDRLVRPHFGDQPPKEKEEAPEKEGKKRKGGGDDGGDDELHPFIRGLLQTLPPAETSWSVQQRADWLTAAATMFKLIYKGEGDITVAVKTDQNQGPSGPETE